MPGRLPRHARGWLRGAARLAGAALLSLLAAPAMAQEPLRLRVVGGLAGVSQFLRYEEPFWRDRLPGITGGRAVAEVTPSDRSGLKPEDMLQLLQRGTVPFGTILLAQAAAEEPEFQALDLPLQNPDIATLRRTVQLYRPHLQRLLAERYGIELLAIYTYPAQVTWCRRPFTGLADLAGRRIRTSSLGQAEIFEAIGATPVTIPFAGIVPAMREGAVECAVTGALSGNAIGLQEVATHIHDMALSWGVSMFGANRAAWAALPEEIRGSIRAGLGELEAAVWKGAEEETVEGMRCATGAPDCTGRRGNLTLVPMSREDEARRRGLLLWMVLPRWIDRCGPDCANIWNSTLAPALGIQAHAR
ncbi:TRAP transporter substrate-binding protein [Pararoseomonas baculiformis]|nr:TRAP transporter substrate-binding protein [Pararoseomonas baculiformis]